MGSAASREAVAAAAAIALHVGLLLVQPRGASVLSSPPAPALADVIELDSERPAAPAPAPSPVVAAASVVAPPPAKAGGAVEEARASSVAPVNAKSVAVPEAPLGERPAQLEAPRVRSSDVARSPSPDVVTPSPSPSPNAAPRADLSQPPPPAGGALGLPPGLGGAPVWALPGVLGPAAAATPAAAPTAAPAARPVDRNIAGKVIDGTLHKRDHDLGLDTPAAGVVASSIADAVRSSAIPGDARATFEVRLGAGGDVEGVRLLSATAGDAGTWDRVVRSARGALAGRALRVGADAHGGTTVVVKIESSVQYPAGSKQKLDVEPVCANEVLDAIAEALKNPGAIGAGAQQGAGGRGAVLGAGAAPPEGMYWDPARRKFCIPIGVRGRGDMSNAGAHPVNLIKSSFSVKRDGERALQAEDVLPIDTRVPWARADPTLTRAPPPPRKKKKWEK